MPNFDSLQDELAALCQRHHIIKLALFGSLARGEARPDSDVDLLAEFAEGKSPSLFGLFDMEEDFSSLFEGRRVELGTFTGVKPHFWRFIRPDLRVLYEEK